VKLISDKAVEITEKDWQQEESLWMSFDEIDKVAFRPTQLSGRISYLVKVNHPQYLGYVREN